MATSSGRIRRDPADGDPERQNASVSQLYPATGDGSAAGLLDALAGGTHGSHNDHDRAYWLLQRSPGFRGLMWSTWTYHARAAEWALTSTTARGAIFAAGYPPPHNFKLPELALRAQPEARFAYVDPGGAATAMNKLLLARPDPEHVAALAAAVRDPAGLLGTPEVNWAADGGPVNVHLVLALSRWPRRVAARALREYSGLLPSGSSVCMTVGSPDAGPDGDALVEGWARSAIPCTDTCPWISPGGSGGPGCSCILTG